MTFPKSEKAKKVIHLSRAPTASVTAMIDDAYQIVSQQLSRFRGKAGITEFDVKDATTLHKLVCTLKILEDSEQSRVSTLQLNGLSQESLDALNEESKQFMLSQAKEGEHKS